MGTFTTRNQQWLSPNNLQIFADAIHDKGAPLENYCGFVDKTVRPIYRPIENQRIVYNGHKKVHTIKSQSLVAPSDLMANLFGPVEGRTQPAIVCSKSTIETLEQGVKYVQS